MKVLAPKMSSFLNRFGQPQRFLPLRLEEMKCQPLCAFLTDPGQPHELTDQFCQQSLLINTHDALS